MMYISMENQINGCISYKLRFKYDKNNKFSQRLEFCIQCMKINCNYFVIPSKMFV